ncbi:MAG: hypothetical protein ACP5FH_02005 [Terracidiphilus sp.]
MKRAFVRTAMILAFAAGWTATSCAGQNAGSTESAPKSSRPHEQIIFSRSTGANGQTTTTIGSAATLPAIQTLAKPLVDDAERQSVTVTSYDLNVHLTPAEQQIAVRALLTIRNDGASPLSRIPLQISSSLNWEEIRLGSPTGTGRDLAFQVATLNSDADHTGQLHEAEIPLGQSAIRQLAPGASLRLDVTYAGPIPASAQRLQSIGAPDTAALSSDWDQISVPFTGLRGFGNVVWYPVSSVPVLLGDGARLFDEIGRQKLRLSDARFDIELSDEFPHGLAPTVAVLNGRCVPLKVNEPNDLDETRRVDGVATTRLKEAVLGFQAPSLFVAIRTPHPGAELTAWTTPDDNVSVEYWLTAAEAVTPFLQNWLGPNPNSHLTLLDLPNPQDTPFETGALLAAPLNESGTKPQPDRLEDALVHALTRAWFLRPDSSRLEKPAWLNEGLATFMTTLWVEKRHGREAALRMMETSRPALALAEPSSPGESAGQPLSEAISPVYYRTKAAYVLWMLRDLAGTSALAPALRAYEAETGISSTRRSFEKLLEASAGSAHLDLNWFFADWVNADKGLPDLSIAGVYPNPVEAGNWLVAVDLANSGYAAAEIPLTVSSMTASGPTSVTRRVLVPARGRITERILVQGKPISVQANDGSVPETGASVHVMNLNEPDSSSQTAPQ